MCDDAELLSGKSADCNGVAPRVLGRVKGRVASDMPVAIVEALECVYIKTPDAARFVVLSLL